MLTFPIRKRITLSSLHVYLADWGTAARPPLLLVHGLASTHHMFDLIAAQLAKNFHVYSFDQRGHGLADKLDTGYDFERIAGDIDELLVALQIQPPIIMLGHSWGGFTTLYYAATRPEKIAKGVLLDGGTNRLRDLYPDWQDARIALSPPRYQNKTIDDIRSMIQKDWLRAAFRPELEPLAMSVFDTSDPSNVRAYLDRDHHIQIVRAIWEFDPEHYYAKVKCPMVIIYAQADQEDAYSRQLIWAREAQHRLFDVNIVWMQDTIHDIPWHKPNDLVRILTPMLT